MLVYGISSERVFGILTWRSQQTNLTPRVLAERFVAPLTAEATLPASFSCPVRPPAPDRTRAPRRTGGPPRLTGSPPSGGEREGQSEVCRRRTVAVSGKPVQSFDEPDHDVVLALRLPRRSVVSTRSINASSTLHLEPGCRGRHRREVTVLVMRKTKPETTNEQRNGDPIDAASINIAPRPPRRSRG
nr:ANTAR domain-containing protein [Rhodococcus wratislaviensis]